MRRHGWQLPLHPLQIIGMGVFAFLVVAFYVFLGPFLGDRIAENTILTLFSFAAFSVVILYIRCTWIDPSDRTSIKKKKKKGARSKGSAKLDYKFIMYQIVARFFRRMEHKILKSCIRRRYMDPWNPTVQMEPLLPFPLVTTDDAVAPYLKDEDITFCSLCDFEGMRTYDYILAMREESQSIDPFDDSDLSSDESIDLDSPEKPTLLSRFLCRGKDINQATRRLSITIVQESTTPSSTSDKKHEIRIDPWKLITMSKERALMAAERTRERIMRPKPKPALSPLKPLPLETRRGPAMEPDGQRVAEVMPAVLNGRRFSSPRRRFSGSPSPRPQKYRNKFDLKLTEVSRELETYISRQVLCSVLKKDGEDEASPR